MLTGPLVDVSALDKEVNKFWIEVFALDKKLDEFALNKKYDGF